MGFFSSIFHPDRPYKKAQEELERYYNEAKGFQAPYTEHGNEAYGGLSQMLKELMDPQALQDKWSGGYQESDAAKIAEEEAKQRGLDSASSLGLTGSTAALKALQGGTYGIMANDRQKYLDDLMQKYMTAIGLGTNIYNTGANAASNLSGNAMNAGNSAAQLQFGRESAGGDLIGKIGGALAGYALGGPLGGALSAGISQKMGWPPSGSYNPNSSWSLTGGR